MSSLNELIHYCNEPDPVGALMLTGEWGCGKTYLIEKELSEALNDATLPEKQREAAADRIINNTYGELIRNQLQVFFREEVEKAA